MKETDISGALIGHLLSMPDVPWVALENTDLPSGTKRPYLTMQIVRVSRRNGDLQGGTAGVIARGFLQIGVVGELDVSGKPAEVLADTIAAHFPKGLRLTRSGGVVTITEAPDIKPATRDNSDWMVPVQISYSGVTT